MARTTRGYVDQPAHCTGLEQTSGDQPEHASKTSEVLVRLTA